ncbi:MAG: hypothetical protein SGI72_11275 [Planctomycetota bacterium]|nr:hypothetical protein [Planctomycetota bacterium]
MKVLVASLVAGLAFAGGEKLATKYSSERDLKYEITSSMTMEVTSMEGERNGEPIDAPGHGMKSEMETVEVHIDHVIDAADGKPTKVRRHFEKIAGTMGMTMGENSNDSQIESPFNGITLELTETKDGVEAEVVDGTEPEGEGALKGHRLDSFLDGFLPTEAVEVDASWDLEKTAISRALRIDQRKVLFPRPSGGGGPNGGGGGGRRGGMRGGGTSGMLDDAEWKGTAKLISIDKDIDGVICSVIQLKLEASGEREMPTRAPRGGMFAIEPAFENTMSYDARLEGTFAFSTKEQRPVQLALEGTLHTDTKTEFSNEEFSMKMHTKSDGKIEIAIEVSEEKPKTDKAAKSDK